MSEVQEIVQALKRALKERGVLYAQIADALGVSESTVKRMFASGNFTLDRLQQICQIIEIEIADLTAMVIERRARIEELSLEQEEALVGNFKLLMLAFLLLNNWRIDAIVRQYQIDELESVRLLVQLDQLGIIDLQPGNRPKLLLSRNFRWRPRGPIQRFFEQQVQSEFFRCRFDKPLEHRLVLNGMLSDQSIRLLQQRFDRLADEFEARVKEDSRIDLDEHNGTTAVLAIRPWSLSLFDALRRQPGDAK